MLEDKEYLLETALAYHKTNLFPSKYDPNGIAMPETLGRYGALLEMSRSAVLQNNIRKAYSACYLFLIWWNFPYYLQKRGRKRFLSLHLWRIFDKTFNLAREYQREKLLSIDLSNADFRRKLEEVFDFMRRSNSIGSTGASKVLHILNSELFPLWDNSMRKGFGLREDTSSYIKFMEILQFITRKLDEKYGEKNILSEHVEMLGAKPAPEILEPLTKILDESNFIVFTRIKLHAKPITIGKAKAIVEELQKLLTSDISGADLDRRIRKILT